MSFTGKSDLQLCPNIITEIEAMELLKLLLILSISGVTRPGCIFISDVESSNSKMALFASSSKLSDS